MDITPLSLPADKLFIPSWCNLRQGRQDANGTNANSAYGGWREKNVKMVNLRPAAPEGKEVYARMSSRALIVDDEMATRQLIEKVLTSRGIESVAVSRSAEASELLSRGKFAVVFVDSHVSFPDGLELTRRVRDGRYNRMTTVILMSDDRHPKALSKGSKRAPVFSSTSRLTRTNC